MPGPSFNVFAPPAGQETEPSSGTDFIYPFDEEHRRPTTTAARRSAAAGIRRRRSSWAADSDQAATQLFCYVNRFHDHLESPGDRVHGAENFEGAAGWSRRRRMARPGRTCAGDTPGFPGALHVNNANMLTLPDGSAPGLMQMYLWDPDRDDLDLDEEPNYRPVHGGDDPSLVFHEYTHGLTNRLVTDAAGLRGAERGAGRRDRRGHRRLVRPRLPGGRGTAPYMPDDATPPGRDHGALRGGGPDRPAHAGDRLPGGRATTPPAPTRTERRRDGGYTYGDFAKIRGGAEAHDDGEIWAQTLWELRKRLIDRHGVRSASHAPARW